MAIIKFKKGTTANNPTGLTLAEPAFDYVRNRLFIGITGSAVWIGAGITTGNVGVGSTLIIPTQSAVVNYVVAGISQAVTSVNGITGPVGISAGSNITITASGKTLTISSSGGGGVSSVNTLTGAVGLTGDGGAIIAPTISGQNIIFRTRLGQAWNGTTGATGVNNYNCNDFVVNNSGTVSLNNFGFCTTAPANSDCGNGNNCIVSGNFNQQQTACNARAHCVWGCITINSVATCQCYCRPTVG